MFLKISGIERKKMFVWFCRNLTHLQTVMRPSNSIPWPWPRSIQWSRWRLTWGPRTPVLSTQCHKCVCLKFGLIKLRSALVSVVLYFFYFYISVFNYITLLYLYLNVLNSYFLSCINSKTFICSFVFFLLWFPRSRCPSQRIWPSPPSLNASSTTRIHHPSASFTVTHHKQHRSPSTATPPTLSPAPSTDSTLHCLEGSRATLTSWDPTLKDPSSLIS